MPLKDTVWRFFGEYSLGVIRFSDKRVQTLIVEVNPLGICASQNAIHSTIVLVQESECSAMAFDTLDVGAIEHLVEIQNVSVQMHTVHPIGLIRLDVLKAHITLIVGNCYLFDIFESLFDLFSSFLVTPAMCHFEPPDVNIAQLT